MSDSDTVGPALTNWGGVVMENGMAVIVLDFGGACLHELPRRDESGIDAKANAHRIAALCLYGQPFGFTQEDVALVQRMKFEQRGVRVAAQVFGGATEDIDAVTARLASLASRIAALLPPSDSEVP